jgi:ADP-heptose:LPS heptosyltransferase
MAGFIKQHFPTYRVIFLGRSYTKDVVSISEYVDEFVNFDDFEKIEKEKQKEWLNKFNIDTIVHVFPNKKIAHLAKSLQIKTRVGTTNRFYHWFTCNKLIRLSRRNSNLHEAQLNLQLLSFLKLNTLVQLITIPALYGFNKVPNLKFDLLNAIDSNKTKVILHPKSKGSAKEWGLANFKELISKLPNEKYQVFISGTNDDALKMKDFLEEQTSVINLCGRLSLLEFIVFINQCDVMIAASTGPLHIAAALNKTAIGLFSSKRPMHPGRWAPIGLKAKALVYDENCEQCKAGLDCFCIEKIEPQRVINLL